MSLSTALLLALVPAPLAQRGEVAPLHWNDERYDADELPEALTPAAVKAYRGWAAWAEQHDYALHLTEDQRVLLVQHSRRKPARALDLIAETAARFDTLLPLPEREQEPDDGTVVVQPGEKPPQPPEVDPDETWTWKWEDDGGPLETDTAVIMELRNEEDQRSVIAKLTADFDYLEEWSRHAVGQVGFSLERPLCAAWLETADGQEEFDNEHELINRTTQVLLLRRFGQVPFWLLMGIAWTVEWDLREALYCFPYRAEFIYTAEHSAWLNDLESEYEDRKKKPLQLDEIARWRRGTYEGAPARRAFGLVHFIATHRPESLTPFVESLRLFRDEHGRTFHGDGTWTRIPGYEVPIPEQQRALLEAAGEDVFEQATEFFWRGKRYRHPKKKN